MVALGINKPESEIEPIIQWPEFKEDYIILKGLNPTPISEEDSPLARKQRQYMSDLYIFQREEPTKPYVKLENIGLLLKMTVRMSGFTVFTLQEV